MRSHWKVVGGVSLCERSWGLGVVGVRSWSGESDLDDLDDDPWATPRSFSRSRLDLRRVGANVLRLRDGQQEKGQVEDREQSLPFLEQASSVAHPSSLLSLPSIPSVLLPQGAIGISTFALSSHSSRIHSSSLSSSSCSFKKLTSGSVTVKK